MSSSLGTNGICTLRFFSTFDDIRLMVIIGETYLVTIGMSTGQCVWLIQEFNAYLASSDILKLSKVGFETLDKLGHHRGKHKSA
jgi:hypothetical protein